MPSSPVFCLGSWLLSACTGHGETFSWSHSGEDNNVRRLIPAPLGTEPFCRRTKIPWLCFVPKTHLCDGAQQTVIGPQHLAGGPRPSLLQQSLGKNLPRGWCDPRHPCGTQGSCQELKIIPGQNHISTLSPWPWEIQALEPDFFCSPCQCCLPRSLTRVWQTFPLLKCAHLSWKAESALEELCKH